MRFILFTQLLVFAGLVQAQTDFNAFSSDFKIYSDSGIFGSPFSELIDGLETVTKSSQLPIEKIVYGSSMGGRELVVFKIQLQVVSNPDIVLITGATHGNEYLNIADSLLIEFASQPSTEIQEFLQSGGIVYLLPVFNPDGYDRRRRTNNNGKDLNRDFSIQAANHQGFTQQESIAWEQFIASEITPYRLRVVMDYHCCNGSLLFPWAFTMAPLPPEDLAMYVAIGDIMKGQFPGYPYGSTGEILGYTPIGTTKDYYYESHSALAFTFEGAYKKENKKLSQHVLMWNEIFASLRNEKEFLQILD